jgi:hypothetical protein
MIGIASGMRWYHPVGNNELLNYASGNKASDKR